MYLGLRGELDFRGVGEVGGMIDTQSYLNAEEAAHWSNRLSPPTFLKVDRLDSGTNECYNKSKF